MAHKQVYTILLSLCLACLLPRDGLSLPTGQVFKSCSDLTPHHRRTSSQTTAPPYRVILDTDRLERGVPITGTLEGVRGAMFKGFILQARCASCSPERIIDGTFSSMSPNIGTLQCNSTAENTLVHTTPADKQMVFFMWVPPVDLNLNDGLKFRVSVVQSFRTWWTGLVSETLTATGGTHGTWASPRHLDVTGYLMNSHISEDDDMTMTSHGAGHDMNHMTDGTGHGMVHSGTAHGSGHGMDHTGHLKTSHGTSYDISHSKHSHGTGHKDHMGHSETSHGTGHGMDHMDHHKTSHGTGHDMVHSRIAHGSGHGMDHTGHLKTSHGTGYDISHSKNSHGAGHKDHMGHSETSHGTGHGMDHMGHPDTSHGAGHDMGHPDTSHGAGHDMGHPDTSHGAGHDMNHITTSHGSDHGTNNIALSNGEKGAIGSRRRTGRERRPDRRTSRRNGTNDRGRSSSRRDRGRRPSRRTSSRRRDRGRNSRRASDRSSRRRSGDRRGVVERIKDAAWEKCGDWRSIWPLDLRSWRNCMRKFFG